MKIQKPYIYRRDAEDAEKAHSILSSPRSLRLCGKNVFLAFLLILIPAIATAATTQPTALSDKSTVNEVLDALDARGKSIQDFTASVKLSESDNSAGDSSSNSGTIILQRKGPGDARIRVAFSKRQEGNEIKDYDHRYTLDNGMLVERDYKRKQETRTQVLKPGQKLDLFKLGEGPFPLPLGQKKEDVLKLFDVAKIAPAAGDPPGTVHLQLTPKKGTSFAKQFLTIDIWVDCANAMPRRIQTVDINNTSTRTTDLTNVKINAEVSDKDFVEEPLPPVWDVIEGPYQN